MVTEYNEIFLDDKPCQNDSSVIRFLDCFCVSSGIDVGDTQYPECWVTKLYFNMAGGPRNLHCLEMFCVRSGAVVYIGRYLISWECISFQISPKIHCTVFEKLHKFLLLSA